MRLLKTIVIAMGIAIVLGIGALGWMLVQRLGAGASAASAAGTARPAPPFGQVEVTAPAGMRFEQMATAGDRLLLRFSGPVGERILVIDPASGKQTGAIAIPPAGP